ncbi:aminomethyl-transferring glycine dehydrogenase subunit GcvPA [Candidatus Bathyarchaeota archaeon]|nr:MAG: aminomethyl-transferring glycine dehydrogenase subunit GcvPA [Candidatus Bathyarchaeota archaeon]
MATFDHPFLPNAGAAIRKMMLEAIGVASIDELYSDIPTQVRINRPLKVDWLPSEQDVKGHVDRLLAKNKSANDMPIFLGAGIYNHYLPAAVKSILSRTEFQTSYTPYQAEISQGLLQSLFEFQSMIADLTQMDAVNSSLYDGSTALGEAARMASRATGRKKILVPLCLHPDRFSVLKNYTEPAGIRLETFAYDKETGGLDSADLQSKVDKDTAAVYCEVPSFFGVLDPEVVNIPSICHPKGGLSIVGFDPVSLGGLKPPGDYGADIVIAEGQSISTEMNFGGPALGMIGCRGENLIRQLPGRLIGMTTTLDGKERAFSMVLQTREQHIRRERATSNICTNEALFAIGAAAYLSLLGPKGLRELFESILVKTNYAIKMLGEIPGVVVPRFRSQHYQEFVVSFKGAKGSVARLNKSLLSHGVHGGKTLVWDFPELGESALFCVTEVHSTESIDELRLLIEKLLEA